MTRRQDNPILLWLIAKADQPVSGHLNDVDYGCRQGWKWALLAIYDVCRWLDAEDAWLDSIRRHPHLLDRHYAWQDARMAEAGVA